MASALAAPLTVGSAAVPDVLNGFGTAITFQNFAEGHALEGATHQWSEVCGSCEIRISLREGAFLVADLDGGTRALDPGVYELRGYRGLFAFTQNEPHDFSVELHGVTRLVKIG